MPLSDAKIRTTKPKAKPFKLTDGAGLYLEIRPSGAKLWRYRYRIAGRENLYALGEYANPPAAEPDEIASERRASGRFTLSEARLEREHCRSLVKREIHPAQNRKVHRTVRSLENANTFQAVALEWVEKKKAGWSRSYTRQVM